MSLFEIDLEETERKKPRIIRGLENLNIQEGEALEFQCLFEGDYVEATWLFDGVVLHSNIFTKIHFKPNELAQLSMKEAYSEDAGLYKLRLKNKYGEISTSCTVSVYPHESTIDQRKISIEDSPPKYELYLFLKSNIIFHLSSENRFTEPISDVYVHEGQEANFRAIISGQPSPKVTWFCNYKKIAVRI